MSKLRSSLGLLALLVAGCAAEPPPSQLNRTALRLTKPRSIAGRIGLTPKFRVDTNSIGLAFGLIGAAIEHEIDASRLKPVAVHDPSLDIVDQLEDDLAKRFSLTVRDGDSLADLVLRVQTTRWGIQNARLGGVGGLYESKLTLFDARTKTLLVAAECVSQPVEGESVGELSKRGPAGIQEEIASATTYCLDDYRHRVLGL